MNEPLEVRLLADRKVLRVTFDAQTVVDYPAQLLRVESPSAEVQGHHPSQKIIVTGKENVCITALEPVGSYAVRLIFDDGHQTGIYSWDYLRELRTRIAG